MGYGEAQHGASQSVDSHYGASGYGASFPQSPQSPQAPKGPQSPWLIASPGCLWAMSPRPWLLGPAGVPRRFGWHLGSLARGVSREPLGGVSEILSPWSAGSPEFL